MRRKIGDELERRLRPHGRSGLKSFVGDDVIDLCRVSAHTGGVD